MKMQNLGRVWMVLIAISVAIWGAEVKATVNSPEVVKGNAVQLYLKAIGDGVVFPDIGMIDGVRVMGQSTQSSRNVSVVNGAFSSEKSTTKILQFIPTKDMTIPSYTITIDGKAYQTDPIAIKVVTSSAPSLNGNSLFSLQMKASKTKVMVGESFGVTLYFSLKNGVRLAQDIQYDKPSFDGFSAVDMKQKGAYIKGAYQVQELGYILTAVEEGNFTITPAHMRVGLPDRSQRDIFGMSFGTKWREALSNKLDIEVVAPAQPSDLIGDFTLDATLDTQEVNANQPVNLTLKIEGEGNLEGFEFPNYEIEGVTIYSDEPTIETKIINGRLHSTYTKSFAFIADSNFSIPSRSFSMLNLEEGSLKNLEIKGYHIAVKRPVSTMIEQPKGVVQSSTTPQIITKEVIVEKGGTSIAWWMLVIAFMGGVGSLFLLQQLLSLKGKKENRHANKDALAILYPHMGQDAKVEQMVRQLYAKKNGDKSIKIDKKALKAMVEKFR